MDTKIRRRNAIQVQQGGGGDLPAGYTRYDWIKKNSWNDGAYIDTGILADQNLSYELQFDYGAGHSSEALQASSGWAYSLIFNSNTLLSFYTKTTTACLDLGGARGIKTVMASNVDGSYIVNDVPAVVSADNNGDGGNIKILSSFTNHQCGASFRYWKCFLNNELVAHLQPCTNPDGVAGMYDTVRHIFLPNSGDSGSLIVGNDN